MNKRIYFKTHVSAINAAENLNHADTHTWIVRFDSKRDRWFVQRKQWFMIFDAWHNAPWTPRGRKFKNAVETTLMTVIFILACCEPRSWK